VRDWAVCWVGVAEETLVARSDGLRVRWRVMVNDHLWAKRNSCRCQGSETFTALRNIKVSNNCLSAQDFRVVNLLTGDALEAEFFCVSFPSRTGSRDLVWVLSAHGNISSSIFGLAVFFEQNTGIFLLKNTVVGHVLVLWLEEGRISSTNFSPGSIIRIVWEFSDLLSKWVLDNIKSISADITLFTGVVVDRNSLFAICADNTDC